GERQTGLVLWDTTTGKRIAEVVQEVFDAEVLALSPDGKTVAVVGDWGHLYLHEVPSGRLLHKLPPAGERPFMHHHWPAFAPDGRTVVTAGHRSLFFWDVAAGKLRRELKGCRGPVAFSRDGKYLACGDESAIRLFEAATLREARRFEDYSDGGSCWGLA